MGAGVAGIAAQNSRAPRQSRQQAGGGGGCGVDCLADFWRANNLTPPMQSASGCGCQTCAARKRIGAAQDLELPEEQVSERQVVMPVCCESL